MLEDFFDTLRHLFHEIGEVLHNGIDDGIPHLLEGAADPYLHPGTDIVVDEVYHHIDHGMGIAEPELQHDHAFDSGMADLDMGGFGGSDFEW